MNKLLTFDEALHVYKYDGREIPSVTQILQDSKICDYGNMDKKYRDFAMKRGRYVHKATELFDLGTLDVESIDPQIKGYVDGYIKFRMDLKWKFVCSEQLVCNTKEKYAGTLDRIFDVPDLGWTLLDIKSSETPPKWLGLQLSAYREAIESEKVIGSVGNGVGLCLHNNGTYTLTSVFTLKQLKAAFKTFKAAMVVAKFNGRKVSK